MKFIQVRDVDSHCDCLLSVKSIVGITIDDDGTTMIHVGYDKKNNPLIVEVRESYGVVKQKLVELGVEIK